MAPIVGSPWLSKPNFPMIPAGVAVWNSASVTDALVPFDRAIASSSTEAAAAP